MRKKLNIPNNGACLSPALRLRRSHICRGRTSLWRLSMSPPRFHSNHPQRPETTSQARRKTSVDSKRYGTASRREPEYPPLLSLIELLTSKSKRA